VPSAVFSAQKDFQINQSSVNIVGGDQVTIAVSGTYTSTVSYSSVSLMRFAPDQDLRDIGDWLSPLNFKLNQNEIYQNQQAGTGQWLLDCEDFKGWRDGEPQILWCPGIREITLPNMA
jgi:hypothetical protein